jgi:predicted NAD/FAD-binding protein
VSQEVSGLKNIAVVGSGVAGLTTAWLLSKKYAVTLYEREARIGGHTYTVSVDEDGSEIPVDAGFIVLNNKTYPGMHALLAALGVPWRWSDMSFGFQDPQSGFAYAGRGLYGLFGSISDAFELKRWRLYGEILKFSKVGLRSITNGLAPQLTMRELLDMHRFSKELIEFYVLPMGAAIWSCPSEQILDFPAEYFLRFFKNHGLLAFKDRPRWQTVVGGSHSYVKKILASIPATVLSNDTVTQVQRSANEVLVTSTSGQKKFDAVVFACHADQVLPILADPSEQEVSVFKNWKYQANSVCVHTDINILPSNPRYWASWNFKQEASADEPILRVTYDLTRLQGLTAKQRYLVSLNCDHLINASNKITQFYFEHPHYDFNSVVSQKLLPTLNGTMNTWYCGSYHGFGFHEDAIQSALRVCHDFGCSL